MIHRRGVLGLVVLTAACALQRPSTSRLTLAGSLEQGSLVLGRTEPGATATLDGTPIRVAENGVFAFGFAYDRVVAANLALRFADGAT